MDRQTSMTPNEHAFHGSATAHATTHVRADREPATNQLAHDARRVDAAMREIATGDDLIGRTAAEQLAAGGKRMRALLALEAARAAQESETVAASSNTIWAATAVELIHQASLVHDDLMDNDGERRGHRAAWQAHGAEAAILLGDHFLAAAFDAAARAAGTPVMVTRAAAAVRDAVRGQAREAVPGPIDTEGAIARYEARVRAKSGRLMALPVEVGLLAASEDEETVETARTAWTALGAAYQVGDDLSELEGRKAGRSRQSDLIQRRLSAPIAHYLAIAGEDDRQALMDFLQTSPGDDQVAYWRERLLASEAPQYCRRHLRALIEEARAASAALQAPLQQLVETTIRRIDPCQSDPDGTSTT